MSDITPSSRRCSACKIEYPVTAEYWHKNKSKKSGFSETCKPCSIKRAFEWNKTHPERHQAVLDKFKDKYNERAKEKIRENPEKNRQHVLDWQKNNPDKVNKKNREWLKDHPETGKVKNQRHRTRKLDLPHTLTRTEWKACLNYWHSSCAYCGVENPKPMTLDHFIPLNAIGCPGTTAKNSLPACKLCNDRKQDTDPYAWVKSRFPTTFGGILYRIEAYFDSLDSRAE